MYSHFLALKSGVLVAISFTRMVIFVNCVFLLKHDSVQSSLFSFNMSSRAETWRMYTLFGALGTNSCPQPYALAPALLSHPPHAKCAN